MSIADIRCENMESMNVTDRHMCFTPNSLENSKRGVQCTHIDTSKAFKRWGSMYSPEIALSSCRITR